MTDIVERLREDYCSCHDDYKRRGRADPQCESCNTKGERNEAADEIERLRTALRLIEHATRGTLNNDGHHEAAHDLAVAALGQEATIKDSLTTGSKP